MAKHLNSLIFHSSATLCPLALDIDVTKQIAFDGIETSDKKILSFLNAGYSTKELQSRVENLFLPGIGFLINVERQGVEREEMLREAYELCKLAALLGAKGIEVITGPLDLRTYDKSNAKHNSGLYCGLLDFDKSEQKKRTAFNLALVADIAADFGLTAYLEGLSWTPLKLLADQVDVLELCNRKNVSLVIDFWHCYTSGQTPEDIAKLDFNLIYGVHICDSLHYDGGIPNESILRNVSTGSGVLKLDEWVDAVNATGYNGWWSCELFCQRDQQENAFKVASNLKMIMKNLIK